MEIWRTYRPGDTKKEFTSISEYGDIAAEIVDTLALQGLNDVQSLRVLDLARMDVVVKTETKIREVL